MWLEDDQEAPLLVVMMVGITKLVGEETLVVAAECARKAALDGTATAGDGIAAGYSGPTLKVQIAMRKKNHMSLTARTNTTDDPEGAGVVEAAARRP